MLSVRTYHAPDQSTTSPEISHFLLALHKLSLGGRRVRKTRSFDLGFGAGECGYEVQKSKKVTGALDI